MNPAFDGAISTGLFMGSIYLVTGFGKFMVLREFYKPVLTPQTRFPLVLRPYSWMLIVSYVICLPFIILGLFQILFCPGFLSHFLGIVVIVVSGLLLFGAFQEAKQYILIDTDGLRYIKSSSELIEIQGDQITIFYPSPISGSLVIGIYGKDKKILIPLTFQNVNLLNYHITRWQNEARDKSFRNWRPKEVN